MGNLSTPQVFRNCRRRCRESEGVNLVREPDAEICLSGCVSSEGWVFSRR